MRWIQGVWVCGLLSAMLGCASEATRRTASASYDTERAVVELGDSRVSLYQYGGVPFKPYMKELRTPAGLNVLRDAPADHLHHHGLMFALEVDGVDFWGETAGCGVQQHASMSAVSHIGEDGLHGTFVEALHWLAPDGRVLLDERRTMDTCIGATAVVVTWRSELRRPAGMEPARIGGRHYFGLGARFVEAMDAGGRFFNAEGRPGEVFRGEERLVSSRWCAYRSRIGEHDVTVAMFDGPDNPRPATWFTMTEPFAYLSATMAYHEQEIMLPPGETLTVAYGVAVWDGTPSAAQIEAAYARWKASLAEVASQ
ncbi:MAG TPA: hypothetical protein ENN87_04585 [Phycisphaerales bacterium]|nr:hypothetical protein [Phycisphaerales bacterium]